jgi:phosphoribosyl 1,2-cyclic phosphodiesterase
MRIRFHGVRGTIPAPGPHTVRYGGNTACLDILTSDQQVIILDAGTGIRQLGRVLAEEYPGQRITGTVFISHTHWDHIQGFPFFFPAFNRQNRFVIIGRKQLGLQLESVLQGQVVSPYLPFTYRDLQADLLVKQIGDGEQIVVGDDSVVEARALDHPGGCLGFRVRNRETVFTYCSDTTHRGDTLNENVLQLAAGADLLVHDAQYTPEIKERFPHYGHSSWLDAARVAVAANVKTLALFHHDPDASDELLEQYLAHARDIFPRTFLAREGLTLTLPLAELP